MKFIGILSLISYLLLITIPAFAGESIKPTLLFYKEKYPLWDHMQILEDKSNNLTINDIASPAYNDKFSPNNTSILNLSISSSTYWVKIALNYPDAYPNHEITKKWYLEVGSTQMNIAELYIPSNNGGYKILSSDMRTSYDERPIKHINSVFPITMQLGQKFILYIKLEKSTSLLLPLTLYTPEGFIEKVAIEEFIYGLFYGSMLILLIYNLFIYFSVRDISYLYYVLYLSGIIIFEALEMGHGLIHTSQLIGVLDREHILIFIWWLSIFAVLFADSFMNIRENYKKIHYVFRTFLMIAVVSSIISAVEGYSVAVRWTIVFSTAFMPVYLFSIFYIFSKGNKNARFFLVAWGFNILGLMVFSGITLQIIPVSTMSLSATPLGILIESALFSFALANRIKNEQASRIEAENNTIEYMEYYQSIFENSLSGMYTMSLTGKITRCNTAMVKMLGFKSKPSLQDNHKEIFRLLYEDNRDCQYELMINRSIHNTLCISSPENISLWISHSAKLILDSHGDPSHIDGVLVNITQSKLKENAIIEKEKELTARQIAEASSQSKTEFVANMNHEIRTPLTAIIGFSESIKLDNISKSEKRQSIKTIVENSNRLLLLINNILDFTKIEVNKLGIEKIHVDIEKTVNSIREKFYKKSKKKNLRFDLVYRHPVPSSVISDPTRINQILENLCNNAIKFTNSGSILLIISWESRDHLLRFEVVDTGIGMTQDVQKNIFQLFDQADSSSTRQYGGTGLGLAISKKLASLINGDISVLSEPGTGSAFTFSITVDIPDQVSWIEKKRSPNIDTTSNQNTTPQFAGTVLLAEDNIVNQKIIERVLIKTGVKVEIVADGIEACNFCDKTTPDLILMDINMPRRDGLETTRYLRENNLTIPIYALTADSGKEESDRALEAGCNGFLTKPLDKSRLFRALEKSLVLK